MAVIIYPDYFDAKISRSACRKVSEALSFQNPTSEEIAKIARSLGYKVTVEEKHHPAFWYKKRGRIAVESDEKKSKIIKKIAEARKK